jgi:dolichol-phosphate mannosyltransferase
MPLEVINHKMNRGLGETCRDLFERAAEISNMDDIIIRLDCDNTHEPEILINIVQKLRAGYDVVVASRFADGGGQLGVTRYRTTISFLANIFMKVFFPIPGLREYSCGFRGYTAAIVKKSIDVFGNDLIQLKGLGFTCTLEKLIKMALLGAKVTEVPFILRYDQKLSSSKMVSSITTLGYFVMVILYNWPWGGWKSAVKNKSLIERN